MSAQRPPNGHRVAEAAAEAVAWTTAFVAAGYLGRATIIDGGTLSLVWPAAGIAALFLALARTPRLVVLLCLGGATFVVNRTTGASAALATVFVVTNLVQVSVFVGVLRRLLPDVWGFGGQTPIRRFVDLGRLTVVAAGSGLLGAAAGGLGLILVLGQTTWPVMVVWWGRNAVGIIVITIFGLLVAPVLRRKSVTDLMRRRRRLVRAQVAELAALTVASSVLYWVVFYVAGVQPLSFLLLVPALWAGLRLHPILVAAYGLASGTAAIWLTLLDFGPFASIDRTDLRAVVVQVFVAMAVLTGLALAFGRSERERVTEELVQARRAEAERAELLSAVLESMAEGVVVVQEADVVRLRNPAGDRLFQRPVELTNLDGTVVPIELLPTSRALRGESIVAEDYVLRRDTAPERTIVEVTARPLPPSDGDLRQAMVMARDVTVDRDYRDGLSRFAAVVAHDLQNPLTVVEGWTESLHDELHGDSVPTAVARPMVERVLRASAHMRLFIGDLLAYTLTRDQELQVSELDVAELASDVAHLYTDRPNRPEVRVSEMPGALADATLLRQLLDNLVGNAIKYVAAEVRPRVDISGQVLDDGWLEVRVADNGIGIPASEQKRVFEPLQRADGSGTYQGTGLGLAICRQVVQRHGGDIHARSRPGGGTIIVFTIPAASPGHDAKSGAARVG